MADEATEERWVWLPQSDGAYSVPARVLDASRAQTEDGATHVVDHAALAPVSGAVLANADVDDLIDLDELDESIILHTIRRRFARDAIYTAVSSILVAVNPFKV
jgi:myosin heavy subunit